MSVEDFLARERELLGDDAALFGNPLTGNESSAAPVESNLFGGNNDFGAFEAAGGDSGAGAFPSFDAPAQQQQQQQQQDLFGGASPVFANTNTNMEFATPQSSVFAALPQDQIEYEQEPEAVRAWRENFEMTIADRDAKSFAKNEETVRAAKESLDRFYAEYNDKKSKTVARNKESEKAAAALQESTTGNIWERVVKQIDTSASSNPAAAKALKDKISGPTDKKKQAPKAKDTTRMKSLLISLKSDKTAPSHDVQ